MLRRLSTFTLLALLICGALFAATADAKRKPAKPKPTVRVVTQNIKVKIPETDANAIQGYFEYAQRATASCRFNERSVGSGIVDAPRYLASQSFGTAVVGGYATGAPGTVTMKLQVLCARNAKVGGGRVAATTSFGQRRGTATGNCPRGSTAIGSPMSQEYAPGYGSFSSKPHGARGWQVVVNGVPELLMAKKIVPAYADFTCVKAIKVQKKQLKLALSAEGTAGGRVSCTGGRRALGWGVELDNYTYSSPREGRWTIPIVKRAQFVGNNMLFSFATPEGADLYSAAGTRVVAHAICGTING